MSIHFNAVSSSSSAPTGQKSPARILERDIEVPDALSSVDDVLWQDLVAHESEVLETPTDPHITQYLNAVKSLLKRALSRHRAKSAPYWSPKGRFRQMVHIEEINQALDELLRDIRSGHPATQLARRLDAIRGLLLDLWV